MIGFCTQYREADAEGVSALAADEVRLWCVPLDADVSTIARLASVLDAEETARAGRFRFPEHRNDFVVARGLLRHLLGHFLSATPSQVAFSYGVHGKPELTSNSALRFNISHSGRLVLYAFALNRELGVDIEHHREMSDLDDIARRFFSAAEVEDLLALPPSDRSLAFFRCWTRKESFIKAIGDGLYLPLDSFRVSLRPQEPAAILAVRLGEKEKWFLADVTPCEDYSAALMVQGGPVKITAYWARSADELVGLLAGLS